MSYGIKRKVEDAIESVLEDLAGTALNSITVFKGVSFSEKTTPRIEIVADTATPQIVGGVETGNWTVRVVVSVCTHKNDATREQHGQRCDAVEEVFLRTDVVTVLNAAGVEDFYCMEFTPGQTRDRVDGSEIISDNEAELFCAPMPPPTS
jgi:hypothetical protein